MSKIPSIRCGKLTCSNYDSSSESKCSIYADRNECGKSRQHLKRCAKKSKEFNKNYIPW